MRKILLFRSFGREVSEHREFQGVKSYAKTRGWDLISIPNSDDLPSIQDAVSFWKPQGCIVANTLKPKLFTRQAMLGTPMVFLDLHPSEAPRNAVCVFHDSEATAFLAAKELLEIGHEHFAYAGWFENTYWNRLRREGFHKALAVNGRRADVFLPTAADRKNSALFQRRLRTFLRSVTRPCALVAANDEIGGHVVAAAAAEGLKIPHDIAVVGVDDNESICKTSRPPLSSVLPDFEQGGFLAAKALDELMRDGSVASRALSFGPLCVVRRASTRPPIRHDRAVVLALEYIRAHACEGIRVDDVTRVMKLSRRVAEMRFRRNTGTTIISEIINEQIEHVKILLRQGNIQHTAIADRCGWHSLPSLCRCFKRKTGLTLSEFRRKNTKTTDHASFIRRETARSG